jgi:hypothetical protein
MYIVYVAIGGGNYRRHEFTRKRDADRFVARENKRQGRQGAWRAPTGRR